MDSNLEIPQTNAASAATSGKPAVYSWGLNASGQLGQPVPKAKGKAADNRMLPTPIKKLPGIVHVASFQNATFAVNQGGQVYAFGKNFKGSLGIDEECTEVPKLVPGL